jgi:hypothetical protein
VIYLLQEANKITTAMSAKENLNFIPSMLVDKKGLNARIMIIVPTAVIK